MSLNLTTVTNRQLVGELSRLIEAIQAGQRNPEVYTALRNATGEVAFRLGYLEGNLGRALGDNWDAFPLPWPAS
jgi:hypothetical protein